MMDLEMPHSSHQLTSRRPPEPRPGVKAAGRLNADDLRLSLHLAYSGMH
jgi:hypothetical protein